MYNANKTAHYALLYGASAKTIKRTFAKLDKRMPARKRARMAKEAKLSIQHLVVSGFYVVYG